MWLIRADVGPSIRDGHAREKTSSIDDIFLRKFWSAVGSQFCEDGLRPLDQNFAHLGPGAQGGTGAWACVGAGSLAGDYVSRLF